MGYQVVFFSVISTEDELDNIINYWCGFIEIILSVRSMAFASALKIKVSLGKRFLLIFF